MESYLTSFHTLQYPQHLQYLLDRMTSRYCCNHKLWVYNIEPNYTVKLINLAARSYEVNALKLLKVNFIVALIEVLEEEAAMVQSLNINGLNKCISENFEISVGKRSGLGD